MYDDPGILLVQNRVISGNLWLPQSMGCVAGVPFIYWLKVTSSSLTKARRSLTHINLWYACSLRANENGNVLLGEILRLTLKGNYERMTAETEQVGLISEVLEDDALIEKALWLAESILRNLP